MRILNVLHSLAGGGIENLLLSYLSHMDRTGLQFDFMVYGSEIGALEKTFEAMGCRVYHVPHRHDDLKGHIAQMTRILREGRYDIVHSHQSEKGFVTLRQAKRLGVGTRILHAHNAFPPESAAQRLARKLGAFLGKRYATDWFACSRDAGRWLYGDRAVESGRVHVMYNAIDLNRFAFDPEKRARIRDELNLHGRFVIGCAARFTAQKNHLYLLEVFARILQKRPDALLLLAGEGELQSAVRERAEALGVARDVQFLGVRTDMPALFQGMDAFVLPSVFEGLGIVFLEAQDAGLPTFGPDIPGARDTAVSELMTLIKPIEAPSVWAEAVIEKCDGVSGRKNERGQLARAGYDIAEQAKLLEAFYRGAKTGEAGK